MASRQTYDQEVVFIHRQKKNVTHTKLQKQAVRVWVPLQITELKTRTVFMYLFLSNGGERVEPITVSLPLSDDMSCDVMDYTCEALFQDGKDEKERIRLMMQHSGVKNFSVDVDHIPPSTYTVTGLNPSSFENDKHPFTDQSRDTKLDQETSSIEKGLQKLVLSSKPEKQRTEHPEKVQKKGTPCSSLVFLKDIDTNGISLFSTMNSEMTFPFQLCPITDYELVVFRGKETKKCCFRVQAVAQCLFKSYMTQVEIDELHKRAVGHTLSTAVLPSFYPVKYLYRNKPLLHFLHIFTNTKGIMFKYIKNFGGDPASTLNRKLHGLFFSANVDPKTGDPPPVSYYGDQRIHIPVSFMITPDTNLYFADFYCHNIKHKVTLVVTLKGSKADEFCSARLKSLNQSYNEFLYRSPDSTDAMVNTRVTVEVFYTESIDIGKLLESRIAYFTTVQSEGNPFLKTLLGRPKREGCKTCNLK
ncbi:uncharacterized protein LOC111135772 isoform X1 [Crassostrea virginica]